MSKTEKNIEVEVVDIKTKTRGRWTEADKVKKENESFTYKNLNKKTKIFTNTNGVIIVLLRLSSKTKSSAGDERQKFEVDKLLRADGVDMSKVIYMYEVGSAWKKGKLRPVLDKIMAMCKNGEVAAIYCYEISRLTRNPEVMDMIKPIIRDNNVKLRIVMSPQLKPENDDLMNEMILTLLVQQAKTESDTTSYRTASSHKSRAETGVKRNGSTPYGMLTEYVVTPLRAEPMGIFAPDFSPDSNLPGGISRAELVISLFDDYLNGTGISGLAKKMNTAKIPTSYDAESWGTQIIGCILRNPIYAGYSTYKGEITLANVVKDENGNIISADKVALNRALISVETFEAVQQRLLDNRGNKSARVQYRLSGILRCGTCAESLTGMAPSRRTKRSYHCNTRTFDPKRCSANQIIQEPFEDAIYDILVELFSDKKTLAMFAVNNDVNVEDFSESINVHVKQIEKLKIRLEAEDDDMKSAISKVIKEKEFEIEKINNRIKYKKENLDLSNLSVEDFQKAWNSNDYLQLKVLLKSIFKDITISKAKTGENLNNYQLAKLGWKCNLNRITINFNNGVSKNLGEIKA